MKIYIKTDVVNLIKSRGGRVTVAYKNKKKYSRKQKHKKRYY